MFESAEPLRDEFAALEAALSDPEIHADLARARKVGRRYAELTPIVTRHGRVRADWPATWLRRRSWPRSTTRFAVGGRGAHRPARPGSPSG